MRAYTPIGEMKSNTFCYFIFNVQRPRPKYFYYSQVGSIRVVEFKGNHYLKIVDPDLGWRLLPNTWKVFESAKYLL